MTDRSSDSPDPSSMVRLQKVLAFAGFGSRRQCEELILDGRVEIDRVVVTELGTRADLSRQQVRVDGVVVKSPRHKCFVLNKPVGVVSTARDPWARTRVIDLVDDPSRLFTVGRLDKSSSGLILVTNDGDLAHRLTHPSFGVEKVYRVVVAGKPSPEAMRKLRQGVHLSEGKARISHVTLKKAHSNQSLMEIVLAEGRNREIRRLLARVGHKVQQLKRIAIGPVRLGELPVGAYRALSQRELTQLRRSADSASKSVGSSQRRSSGRATGRDASQTRAGGRKRPGQSSSSSGSSRQQATVLGGDPAKSRSGDSRKSGSAKRPGRRPARRTSRT